MSNRKEPVLSGARPGTQTDTDDLDRPLQTPSGKRRPPPISSRPVIVRSKLAPLAFLVGLAGLGLAGFVYYQFAELQKQLVATQKISDARIVELEGKLTLTGDESTASMAALQAKLKWADSEIRKLWGVSHDTNRKNISTNTSSIQSANKSTTKKLNSLSATLDKVTKDTALELKIVSDLTETQMNTLAAIESTTNKQKANVENALAQLKAQEARLKETEQAINAIDNFRRQVNADLLKLKGSLAAP